MFPSPSSPVRFFQATHCHRLTRTLADPISVRAFSIGLALALALTTSLLLSSRAGAQAQLTPPMDTLPALGAGPALIIAVDKYGGDSAFADLPGITHDWLAVKGTARKLGLEEREISVVVKRTKGQLLDAMNRFGRAAALSKKVSFLYYTGHGVLVDGQNYLIPAGAPISVQRQLEVYAVPIEHVLSFLGGDESGPALVFVDACRNNVLPRTAKSASSPVALQQQSGLFIGYATGAGRISNASEEGSVFTSALCRWLLAPGRSVDDLYSGVIQDVQKATAGEKVPQNPQKQSALRSVLHLVPGSSAPGITEAEMNRRIAEAVAAAKAQPSVASLMPATSFSPSARSSTSPGQVIPSTGSAVASSFQGGDAATHRILLQSLQAGVETEVTAENLTRWESPTRKVISGRPYSSVIVSYEAKRRYGTVPARAEALIFNGRVEKWIHPDTNEVLETETEEDEPSGSATTPVVAASTMPAGTTAATNPVTDLASFPTMANDPRIHTILLASLRNGAVTEVTPQNLKGWGTPESREVNGRTYASVKVAYEARRRYGTVPAEAEALILNGRVESWILPTDDAPPTPAPASTKDNSGDMTTEYILLASMRNGGVTTVTPENIKSWSEPVRKNIGGTAYQAVTVTYEVERQFGTAPALAEALILNGTVRRWIDPESGEVLP